MKKHLGRNTQDFSAAFPAPILHSKIEIQKSKIPPASSGPTFAFSSSMTGSVGRHVAVPKEDDWQLLLDQALIFATERVNRFRWRGSRGGVLPDGYDAEAIAAEAIAELFQSEFQCFSFSEFQRFSLLRRLVWKRIDRLHRRKENFLVRNETDLAPVHTDDGETISLIESLPDPGENPLTALIRAETNAEFDSLRCKFGRFVGGDRLLKSLLIWQLRGIRQPSPTFTTGGGPIA